MVNFKRLSWTKNTLSNILLNQVDTEREFMSYGMLLKPDMYSNVQKYKKLRTTPLSENDPTLANFPLTFRIYICRIRQLCSIST